MARVLLYRTILKKEEEATSIKGGDGEGMRSRETIEGWAIVERGMPEMFEGMAATGEQRGNLGEYCNGEDTPCLRRGAAAESQVPEEKVCSLGRRRSSCGAGTVEHWHTPGT